MLPSYVYCTFSWGFRRQFIIIILTRARGNLLDSTGSSSQCSVVAKRGGVGRREGGPRGRRYTYIYRWASQVALVVKNPPLRQETHEIWVWSLGQEDPLEKGTATHSNILAWRIPWTEEPGRCQSIGSQRVRHDRSNLAHTHTADSLPYTVKTNRTL